MSGLRVDAWRGTERIALDLPVTGWAWSCRGDALPQGKLSIELPPSWWPGEDRYHPIYPMGQYLRAEVLLDGRTFPLPPHRIVTVKPGVDLEASSWDMAIVEEPWPVPTSPRSGSKFAEEAGRLARPLRVHLGAGLLDPRLPDGIAWSGDRAKALVELAESYGARLELDADGTILLLPLGNPAEPDLIYTSAREITAADYDLERSRVTLATVVSQETQDHAATVVSTRLTHPDFQPEVYGTIGRVETSDSGASDDDMRAQAAAMLAETGSERTFSIRLDPRMRVGMSARFEVRGREPVTGRIASFTMKDDGTHEVTVRGAYVG